MSKLGIFVSVLEQSERLGGLSNTPGYADSVTSGQMMIGLMERDSILDPIIDKFSLMDVYQQKSRGRMRSLMIKKIMETKEDNKNGMVIVGILDEDPQRAADIANAFVDALQEKVLNLSLNEATQRRAFFEKQLFQARQYLDDVQKDMLNYQEQLGGVAIPQAQMEATLRSITDIQQQIADKKVEISAMRTYAPSTNPRLRAANSQLEALTKELERLEEIQKNSSSQLSVEYQRHEMRVQYATKNYEALLQKLEEARLDESQGFFQLQVVDYATAPDVKYKPSRARILILGTFVGVLLGCAWVMFSNFSRGLKKAVKQYEAENPDTIVEVVEPEDDDDDNNSSVRFSLAKILSWCPAIILVAAIMLLTFQPTLASQEMGLKFQSLLKSFWISENYPMWLTDIKLLRGLAHVFLYLPLSMALYYAAKHFTDSWAKAAFIALVISCAVGLADEAVKMFLPNREFDFTDWILDIVGSVAGIVLASLCRAVRSLRYRKENHSEGVN